MLTTPTIAAGIHPEQETLSSIHTLAMYPKNRIAEKQTDNTLVKKTEEKGGRDEKAPPVVKTAVVHERLLGR
ncbi:uncharacterized protein N7515_003747 [Penicillium bovifimosum]|uniref:Uncharacterized protein n=1 Tax=Penicillium bovifimosum TaxID=126998 RepID=A0A9W9L617_9EURO|nr:uncharacterized protein N7515_003747 [Penicillium bovifimosum]KAJ5138899.1 hypothetical protein N7515_003747 [Penicillium bovifimosum]